MSAATYRDIVGRDLAIDQHVLLCEHNRLILGQIVKLHPGCQSRVTVKPLNSSAGLRRAAPSTRPLLRLSYNLYLVTESELIVAILRGQV